MGRLGSRIVVESNGAELWRGEQDLTVGSRTGCDLVVDDPVLAQRHCRFSWDGAFRVSDLGSATGTWVDGRRASASTEVTHGCEIVVGVSRLSARVDAAQGITTLTLDLQRSAFFWKKPGKGVFDNDPDAWVRTEVGFGRWPLLRATNRLAAVLALVLLMAALFVGAFLEPLVDPGPLLPAHALLAQRPAQEASPHALSSHAAQIAAGQGCEACHVTGQGTPDAQCLQCHAHLNEPSTWRHPFFGDGVVGAVPGQAVGEGFCATCHRDHQGTDFLKPYAHQVLGDCAACHAPDAASFDKAKLIEKAPPIEVGRRQRPHSTVRFPHDRHAEVTRCDVCHRVDPQTRARHAAGAARSPDQRDFAEVPFETCAACHVPGARPAPDMTPDEQARWRVVAKDHQWPVAWHGTDEGGQGCKECHATSEREGVTVFGPAMRTVERARESAEQYAAERGRYVTDRRMHEDEFQAHASGRACIECHVRGELVATPPRPARPFWHALHLPEGSLTPHAGNGAAVSLDATAGCISCHHDRRQAKSLHGASSTLVADALDRTQSACRACHADGDRDLVLQPVHTPTPPERQVAAADFPHDVHVGSKAFGQPKTPLADGCFACHEFEAPGGRTLQSVPRTRTAAAECTQCHAGHENIAGDSCQKCHPTEASAANSFLLSSRVPVGPSATGRIVPAAPTRPWPAANRFDHLSSGHTGTDLDGRPITCGTCHDVKSTMAAGGVAGVPIPDETLPGCRACHVRRQFHWR